MYKQHHKFHSFYIYYQDQFLAMQAEDGKLVLYWNFGFENGTQSAVVEENDITQFTQPLLIKAGFAPRSRFVLVTINLSWVFLLNKLWRIILCSRLTRLYLLTSYSLMLAVISKVIRDICNI